MSENGHAHEFKTGGGGGRSVVVPGFSQSHGIMSGASSGLTTIMLSGPAPEHLLDLQNRVRALEEQVAALRANYDLADDDAVPSTPHEQWLRLHMDELRNYPDAWVVLDAQNGVVFSSRDDAEFSAHIATYALEERDRFMILHTSMYV